jgi:hypothetical protein
MTPAAPPPSSRLLRAAAAERDELARHRDRLLRAREDLRAELERTERGLADVEERTRLLDRLAPAPAAVASSDGDGTAALGSVGVGGQVGGARELRGPAIREAAVRLVAGDARRPEALHYREWFALLEEAGHRVAGKDPLAVFLTQLSRSPVVRKATQAGVYELDRGAPARLRARLDGLHEQLRALASTRTPTADLATVRARRAELTAEVGHVEKALEEAVRLLEPEAPAAAPLAATA